MPNKEIEYSKNPKLCLQCNNPIPYKAKRNKYCNHSCAANYTNRKRTINGWTHSETTKSKIKEKMEVYRNSDEYKLGKHSLIDYKICKLCNNIFVIKRYHPRKLCSKKCYSENQSIIGCKNRDRYFNRHFYKSVKFISKYHGEITLDSKWEVKVVQSLEDNNIYWQKPKPFKWIDKDNKTRNYYPDFYIPSFNIYIEPKNPYLLSLSKDKLDYIKNNYNINLIIINEEKNLCWDYIYKLVLGVGIGPTTLDM